MVLQWQVRGSEKKKVRERVKKRLPSKHKCMLSTTTRRQYFVIQTLTLFSVQTPSIWTKKRMNPHIRGFEKRLERRETKECTRSLQKMCLGGATRFCVMAEQWASTFVLLVCVPASKEKYFPSSRPGHIGKWTAASNEMSYQMN